MLRLPDPAVIGRPPSAKDFNALLNYVRAIRVRGGPGILVNIGAGGTTISALAQNGKGGAAGPVNLVHPFKISDTTTIVDDVPSPSVSVLYGQVNNLDVDLVDTDLALSGDGTYIIYIDATVSLEGVATASGLAVTAAGDPIPDDEDYHGYQKLGEVDVADGVVSAIRQGATHSFRLIMCGRTVADDALTARGLYDWKGY